MKRISRLAVIGVSAAMLTGSGASLAVAAHHRGVRKHRHPYASSSSVPTEAVAAQTNGDPAPTPGSVGSFYGGLGRAYDNSAIGYNGALGGGARASAQFGHQLFGGALGDAWVNYVQHQYYYKYDYCQLGSAYVWYLQRCVSPFDLFR